jgi:transposase InsO family protein
MSATVSPSTHRPYGIQRVCAVWDIARSSFYAAPDAAAREDAREAAAQKRGPKATLTDDALLALIRADLAASPFPGEGHRKVWARLKILQGVRTGRKRVLRLMRAHALLSPHRTRRGLGLVHDGTIITDAPGIMWGTDGTRVFTVEQGWCWIFVAVEHWNAECVGWHVCKTGNRYAALEPIAAGLTRVYGSVAADAARGLQLRMDHGTQYLADHFLNQIRYWGLTPSFAFLEQPQTNGVAERFNRTLKEQVIHGRIFHTLDALRTAVAAFVERYNTLWRVEKLGFLTPTEARLHYARGVAA